MSTPPQIVTATFLVEEHCDIDDDVLQAIDPHNGDAHVDDHYDDGDPRGVADEGHNVCD